MTRALRLAVFFVLALLAGLSVAQALGPKVRRIVVFKPDTAPVDRVRVCERAGGAFVRELRLIDAVVVEYPGSEVSAAEAKLKSNPDVLRIDDSPRIKWIESAPASLAELPLPDFRETIRPFKPSQQAPPNAPPAQELPWGIKRVNASEAWSVTRGRGVRVAVIDTGIEFDHPDLKANVAGGWNAVNKEKPNDFRDDHGHGTHVSGTIAAVDDGAGVVGVAPDATLYGVKVLDSDGSGTFDDVIAGMEWCVTNKMQVANMSLGASRGNDSLKAAVEKLAAAGVVLVASAGNSSGAVGYPAAYPQAIAIAASSSGDGVAWFSSRGPEVDLIAPGVSVKSTVLNGAYGSMSGTSMSAPHVSGLAALAIAAKKLTGVEPVASALKAAASPFPKVPPEQQGAGMIDAAKLVR